MVPNTPGGGYDITARTAAKNAEDAGLNHNVEVFNLPGAGGTVGLSRLVNERGNGKLAMSMGLGVVGAVHTNHAPSTLADTTPIARLTEEPDIVVVAKDSPYKTFGQLLADWKKNPGKIAGGRRLLARRAGPPRADADGQGRRHRAQDGQLRAVRRRRRTPRLRTRRQGRLRRLRLGEYLDQIKSGELRLLAVTGPERVTGFDAPTLKESGVDVEFTNWRGIVAPPGLSDTERAKLISCSPSCTTPGSGRTSVKTQRLGRRLPRPVTPSADFLAAQDKRVDTVLKELGL